MGNLDFQQKYERHRPHIHTPGRTLFVTWRLAGSIPQATVREYKARKDWLQEELIRLRKKSTDETSSLVDAHLRAIENFSREWFARFEDTLHKANTGPTWMKNDSIAKIIADNLHYNDGKSFRLEAYCVMSNHVHAVITPLLTEAELREAVDNDGHTSFISEHPSLARIMQSMKGYTARECNRTLARKGQYWEHESFDHVVRQGKFDATVNYVLNNPVKAGLVNDWQEWKWSYKADVRQAV